MRTAATILAVIAIWALAAAALTRLLRWGRRVEPPPPPAPLPPVFSTRPPQYRSGRDVHLTCANCHAQPRIPIEDTALLRDSDGLYRVWASCTEPGCWSVIRTDVISIGQAAALVADGVTEGEALIAELTAHLDEVTW